MNCSIIKKSELEGALRLDAEYYQPEYLALNKKLLSIAHVRLGEIAFITDGEHGSPIFDENSGIKYFSSQFVMEGYIDTEGIKYINKKINDRNKRSQLKKGDILLSIVGTIGKASIITGKDLPANSDRNVATIKIQSKIFLPEYLAVFFNSKYGKFQTLREVAGNVQPIIILSKIRDLIIPSLKIDQQKTISNIYLNFFQKLENSRLLYSQAENLLLEELGLKNFESEIKRELWSVVDLSEIRKANRMDSDFFDPKYTKIFTQLEKRSTHLGDLSEHITKKADIKPTQEYNYIEISDIDVGCGEASSNKIAGKDLPANAKIKISGGELIVSKVRPTRGAIAIIPDSWSKDFVASGAFSVFHLESPVRECVQVVLRSFIGKLQLEKPTTGTSYPTVTDKDVENILIPILPKSIQQQISELVQKSQEARKKAKELFEEAKRKVEELVEDK